MEVVGKIYKIENKVNGKLYIGKTRQPLNKRIFDHFYKVEKGSELAIHKAIRKYGKDSFNIEVIEECSVESLNEREVYYIKHFNTYNGAGYNMTVGGDGAENAVFTEERRKAHSERMKKTWKNPDFRVKMSEISKERHKNNINLKEGLVRGGLKRSAQMKGKIPINLIEVYKKRTDKTSYKFVNVDGREFEGTHKDWRESNGYTGKHIGSTYYVKYGKSYKGWRVVK